MNHHVIEADHLPPAKVLEAMLALVEEKRLQQQQRILDQAKADAARIVSMAHRQARARMHELILQERRRMEQAVKSTQAQLETELRNHNMNVANRLLLKGRDLLEQTLLEQWRNPQSRWIWLTALARRAVEFLPRGQWELVVPQGMEGHDWSLVQEIMQQAGLVPPVCALSLRGESNLIAGVRIGCQGAWVDGTMAGLVANRAAIDALLLALLQPEGAAK